MLHEVKQYGDPHRMQGLVNAQYDIYFDMPQLLLTFELFFTSFMTPLYVLFIRMVMALRFTDMSSVWKDLLRGLLPASRSSWFEKCCFFARTISGAVLNFAHIGVREKSYRVNLNTIRVHISC